MTQGTSPKGELIMQVMIMPKDLNHHGTAFGGTILSHMDEAGSAIAMRRAKSYVMLAAYKGATFEKPVFQSNLLGFYGEVLKVGKTSMTVGLELWREDVPHHKRERVGTAEIVYVAVGADLRPQPVDRNEDA